MSSDRRREDRLVIQGVSLWIRHKDGATICEVVNLSRLGIGLRIPDDKVLERVLNLQIETELEATLKIKTVSIPIGLKVLRINGPQIGCSFIFHDSESQKIVFDTLSPRFVAQTLLKVANKFLNSHLRYAFFGQDFFIIAHKQNRKYQLSASGYDCIIDGNTIKISDHEKSQDTVFEIDYHESYEGLPNLKVSQVEAVQWMISVLDAWDERPEDISEVTNSLKGFHAV